MSLLLLFPTQAVGEAEIKNSAVPLVSGHVYRLTFRTRSSYAPQTLELLIRNSTGLTVSLNTTFEIPTAGITNMLWQFEGLISIPTIGASGEVEGQGIFKHFATALSSVDWAMVNTAVVTKNITALCDIKLSADWQTADTDNSISIREFSVEKIQ